MKSFDDVIGKEALRQLKTRSGGLLDAIVDLIENHGQTADQISQFVYSRGDDQYPASERASLAGLVYYAAKEIIASGVHPTNGRALEIVSRLPRVEMGVAYGFPGGRWDLISLDVPRHIDDLVPQIGMGAVEGWARAEIDKMELENVAAVWLHSYYSDEPPF